MRTPAEQSVPRCPRCDYDQSGAAARWATECPLEGTCPECGLTFWWVDVFNPWRNRSRWLFEHKNRWSPGALRATRSWLNALVPPVFWRKVALTHGCRWSVLLWPLVLIGSWAVLWSSVRTACEFTYGPPMSPRWVMTGGIWTQVAPTLTDKILYRAADAWGNPWYPVNVARWDPSRTSRELLETWAAPLAVVASSVITGLTFLTLTSSRRLCGVKQEHVARAMVYRLAPLGVFYLLWMLATAAVQIPGAGSFETELIWVWITALLLGIPWGVWWWGCAFRRGWKMPDATLATVLLGTVDVLAFVVTFLWLSPFTAGYALQ